MERTIKIGSSSRATAARRTLAAVGIRARVRRIDASVTKEGCAYGLSVSEESLYPATVALYRAGISYEIL